MAPVRNKQRQLIRWNDDLDKSLLLFITHTCTELGIKIPYDVVAQRMGSTFTEGAIQQHISKLRKQMAELQVAPVPPATRRGIVTTKPSSVYTTKARNRAGPAPPPPPMQTRRGTGGKGRNGDDDYLRSHKRTARGVPIKRADSDDGDSFDEFGGGPDDDFEPRNKRTRNNAQVGAHHMQRPGMTADGGVAQMVNALVQADERYNERVRNGTGQGAETQPFLYPGYVSSLDNSGQRAFNFPSTFDTNTFHQLASRTGDDEAEEEAAADQGEHSQGMPEFPAFNASTNAFGGMSLPFHSSSTPAVDDGRSKDLSNGAHGRKFSATEKFTVGPEMNFDFGGFPGFEFGSTTSAGNNEQSVLATASALPGVSNAFQSVGHASATPSPRNASFASQQSTQDASDLPNFNSNTMQGSSQDQGSSLLQAMPFNGQNAVSPNDWDTSGEGGVFNNSAVNGLEFEDWPDFHDQSSQAVWDGGEFSTGAFNFNGGSNMTGFSGFGF